RRIVRALEVLELTGAPFTASLPAPTDVYPTLAIGIDVDGEPLDARTNARAEETLARGVVEEAGALVGRGLAERKTASRAVGYAQALAVLAGRRTRAEATEDVALATRQLARRQRKWFKRDDRITWIEHYETV